MKIYWKIHSYQKANGTILNNPPFRKNTSLTTKIRIGKNNASSGKTELALKRFECSANQWQSTRIIKG